MADTHEVEFFFEPQEGGGYRVYAPDLPGLHTQGDTLEEATDNAREALALYIEGLREEGRSLHTGVVRRKLPVPATEHALRGDHAARRAAQRLRELAGDCEIEDVSGDLRAGDRDA